MKLKFDKLFAALCLIAVVVLYMNTSAIRDLASASDPGARLFPYIGEALLAFCSLLVLLGKSEKTEFLDKAGWIKLAVVLVCMALYALGLKWLGFLVSTPIAVLVFIYLLREDKKVNPLVAVLVAAVLTVGLYFLFTNAFSILLPKGKLF